MAFITRHRVFPGTRMRAIPAMREDGFMSPVSRGFHRRRQDSAENAGRVPPGQYVTKDFPVLSAGRPRTRPWTLEFRHRPSRAAEVVELGGVP